ncbi:MAG: hypothetical protein KBD90_03370, partial [Alphaproteobacteria bacterium]|nr:hypothetical protein [Alphaproteobacteria bacterium]
RMIKKTLHVISWIAFVLSIHMMSLAAYADNPPPKISGPGCYWSDCSHPQYSKDCLDPMRIACHPAYPGNYLESCACLSVFGNLMDGCYCKNYAKKWVSAPIPKCPITIGQNVNGSMSNINGVLTCDAGPGCYSAECTKEHQETNCAREESYCTTPYPGTYLKSCACLFDTQNNQLQCQCETSPGHWKAVAVPDCKGKAMSYKKGKLVCGS